MAKEEALAIICSSKSDEQKFEELFSLFIKNPNHNKGLAFQLNAQRGSRKMFNILLAEIKRFYGIRDLEIFKFKQTVPQPEELQPEELKPEEPKDELKGFREEFPFLSDKDCPEEFKILAADKITAFETVQQGRDKLKALADGSMELTEEEIQNLTKEITEADEENALITDEFYHFLKTKTVLGNHPIFLERKIKEKVEKMTGEEKLKRFETLKKGINKDLKLLDEEKNEKKLAAIQNRLAVKKAELNFIKKLTQ